MTFYEAWEVKKERDKEWKEYYEKCGSPTLDDYSKCVLSAPEGIFNVNTVFRVKGFSATLTEKGKVFECPSGILAWSGPIPEESFISEEQLQLLYWEVNSYKATFDDW